MSPVSIRQLVHEQVRRSDRRYPITLVCIDWRDPRNVGAAFRLADAAGLAGLILGGSTPTPPHPKIAKTARSTVRAVSHETIADVISYLKGARAQGKLVLGLELATNSQSLFTYRLPAGRELLLVAGTESAGLSDEVLAICDAVVHLPMHGQNTSMNVATALSAAVYLLLMQLQ